MFNRPVDIIVLIITKRTIITILNANRLFRKYFLYIREAHIFRKKLVVPKPAITTGFGTGLLLVRIFLWAINPITSGTRITGTYNKSTDMWTPTAIKKCISSIRQVSNNHVVPITRLIINRSLCPYSLDFKDVTVYTVITLKILIRTNTRGMRRK